MMQTMWSRAVLAKNCCRCPQCVSSASGVARRNATTAPRRFQGYLTTSTALYTSIFAAAATYDAGVKQSRREQWDKAIASAKQELRQADAPALAKELFLYEDGVAATTSSQETSEPSIVDLERLETGGSHQQSGSILPDPTELAQTVASTSMEGSLEGLRLDENSQSWPTNTGQPPVPHRLPPQSIYAPAQYRELYQKKHRSAKKLATAELCIDKLQLKVMRHLKLAGVSEEAAGAVPANYGRHFLQTLAEINSKLQDTETNLVRVRKSPWSDMDSNRAENHGRLCSFGQDSDSPYENRRISCTIGRLFEEHKDEKISTPVLLARLMYTLHSSRTLPAVDTYNLLLQGFMDARQPQYVGHVIAVLRGANIRLNEVTLSTILKHYTKANDASRFIRWVELMRGKHFGLALAKPGIRINEAAQGRLLRRPDQPEKVIQLPHATPIIFSALVEGVLKFGGFDVALKICESMGKEGWGLCMRGMTPLLVDCAERSDWDAGRAVWNNILEVRRASVRREPGRWRGERIGLPAYAAMLKLCIRCKQNEVYDKTWADALRAHNNCSESLTRLVEGETDAVAHDYDPHDQTNIVKHGGPPKETLSTTSAATAANFVLKKIFWDKSACLESAQFQSPSPTYRELAVASAAG